MLSSLPQTTAVVEAEVAGTATAQEGRPTIQGHTGATVEVLGLAPTKANKVGLGQWVAQYRGPETQQGPHRFCEEGWGLV